MKKSDYINEEERKTPSAPTLVESTPLEHPVFNFTLFITSSRKNAKKIFVNFIFVF
jgi:hypothetical protein